MSDHSLQKAVKKMLEFRTIHHQNRERRCFSARRCECPTIVFKKCVINGENSRLYIISHFEVNHIRGVLQRSYRLLVTHVLQHDVVHLNVLVVKK